MEQAAQSFGELVRVHRLAAGMTQPELAQAAGVSIRALRDIEQNRVRHPQARSVGRLLDALGLAAPAWDRFLSAAGSRPAPRAGRPHIGVLGPLVIGHGTGSIDPAAAKPRCLLALLAIQPNRVVARDEIVEALWGAHPPRSSQSLVPTYVGHLRRLLEPGRRPHTPAGTLVSTRGGYLLHADSDELDLLLFDRLAARARQLRDAGDGLGAMETYGESLDCWRGPILADLREATLRQHPAAVAAGHRRIAAMLAYADLAIASGEHEPAAERLAALVTDEPLHEGLYARLMLALAGSGQQAAALAVFTALRSRLAEDLGLEPGAEVQEAYLRVLRQEVPRATAPATDGAPLTRPAQLPADLATFTGRSAHLQQLDSLLPAEPKTVVIAALTGTAGVGKTALAIRWAHRVRDRFSDGQLYVDLRGYAQGPPVRPVEVLAQFLYALGVPAEQVPVGLDEAVGLYRSLVAHRRVLVVLDNARDADQVRPLLPGGSGCLVLVTSRDRLAGLRAREGAHCLNLDVLTPDEAGMLLTRLLGPERVAAEPPAVAELAQVCAFLPLALGIAAANLATHPGVSVAGYLADLRAGNRLAALAIEGDPQTAVRATFDVSYATLAPPTARMFRLLGLVPGPDVTADVAAALVDTTVPESGRLLAALAAAHLIGQRDTGRFGFHDLLRAYAAERAETEDTEPECSRAAQRMYNHYLAKVDAAAQVLSPEKLRLPLPTGTGLRPVTGFDDHTQALAWLDAERPSLLAAVQHAARHGPRPSAWLLADGLRGYLWLRRRPVDWLTVAHAGRAAAEADADPQAQASAELSLADALRCQGRYRRAIEHYEQALALSEQAGWVEARSAVLGNLGNAYSDIGRPAEGADHYARALAIDRQSGRLAAQAVDLGNLGFVYQELGRFAEAADLHRQALDLDRKAGCRGGEAIDLANLGETCHALGRSAEAFAHLTDALALHREVGDRGGEAEALHALAAVHRDAGRPEPALELAGSAVALAREIGERRIEAEALTCLGSIHQLLGRHHLAIGHYQQALRLAREAEIRYAEAVGLVGIADAEVALGDPHAAARHANEALTSARLAGYRLVEAQALRALGNAHAAAGSPADAWACWKEAVAEFDAIGSPHADEVRRLLPATR